MDCNDNAMDVSTKAEDSKSPSHQSEKITDDESSEDDLNLSHRLKGTFKKDENSDKLDDSEEIVENSKNKTFVAYAIKQ